MVVGNFIQDGSGGCKSAKVDDNHRLYTKSNVTGAMATAIANEKGFAIVSADIELTSDSESAILYICNGEASKLVVDKVIIGVGPSDGTGLPKSVSYSNPTGGTIITDKSEAIVINLETGSSVSLSGDYYVGGDGKTFTDIGLPTTMFVDAPGYDVTLPATTLPTGSCAGLSIIPPAGNTSMLVTVTLYVYLRDYI